MKVFVDIAEAAERFDELIDFVLRDDEVVICRAGDPIAAGIMLFFVQFAIEIFKARFHRGNFNSREIIVGQRSG